MLEALGGHGALDDLIEAVLAGLTTAKITCRLLNTTELCSAAGTSMNSLASARVHTSRMM